MPSSGDLKVESEFNLFTRKQPSLASRETRMSFFMKEERNCAGKLDREEHVLGRTDVCGKNISSGVMSQMSWNMIFTVPDDSGWLLHNSFFDIESLEDDITRIHCYESLQIQVFIHERVHHRNYIVNLLLFHQHSSNAFVA